MALAKGFDGHWCNCWYHHTCPDYSKCTCIKPLLIGKPNECLCKPGVTCGEASCGPCQQNRKETGGELKKFPGKNITLQPFGGGGQAEIFVGVYDEVKYIFKRCRKLEEAYQEALFLQNRASAARVLSFMGMYYQGRDTYIVLELAAGTLHSLAFSRSGALHRVTAMKICLDVYDCIQHIHVANLVHFDLKPDNIFYFQRIPQLSPLNPYRVKLGDLGLAFDEAEQGQQAGVNRRGNPWVAPEFRGTANDGQLPTRDADWYSWAMICVLILQLGEKMAAMLKDIVKYHRNGGLYKPNLDALTQLGYEEKYVELLQKILQTPDASLRTGLAGELVELMRVEYREALGGAANGKKAAGGKDAADKKGKGEEKMEGGEDGEDEEARFTPILPLSTKPKDFNKFVSAVARHQTFKGVKNPFPNTHQGRVYVACGGNAEEAVSRFVAYDKALQTLEVKGKPVSLPKSVSIWQLIWTYHGYQAKDVVKVMSTFYSYFPEAENPVQGKSIKAKYGKMFFTFKGDGRAAVTDLYAEKALKGRRLEVSDQNKRIYIANYCDIDKTETAIRNMT